MSVSVDSNLIIYAADPDSPHHSSAQVFFEALSDYGPGNVTICGLVLVEVYMQLRNPAVFKFPYSSAEAVGFCRRCKENPMWSYVDYSEVVFESLMHWAETSDAGFRRIIDARLALTLRYYDVTEFATANVRDFSGFGFQRVWNPLVAN